MSSWQILLLNMLFILSTPQPQSPKPLTPQQQQQFEVAFKAGDFKVPADAL